MVVFLFVFQPFGLAVNSLADALVLLGLMPVNLMIMLGMHALSFDKGPRRTVFALSLLVIGNTLYLMTWSQNGALLKILLAVIPVVGLVSLIAYLWNRGRIPEQDIVLGNEDIETHANPIVLYGDGEQEILRLAPGELLFMKANGNYVDVHYLRNSLPAKSMLRSSLVRLTAQVPGNRLVQCHRSYFFNLASAKRIIRAKGRTLIELDSGERIPVSRMFRQGVLSAISI